MKMKLRHTVEILYEFDRNQSVGGINYNVAHAKELLTNMAFIYRVRPHCIPIWSALILVRSQEQNSGDPFHQYRHPIIQKAINILWFKNKNDDGMTFQEHFSPIPIPALALVLTVVGVNVILTTLDADREPTIIRHNAASMSGLMARARSPVGTRSASRTCTTRTSSRSIKFTRTWRLAFRWKKYDAISSGMPGRIHYRICRIVGRFF
jgi:hypothetical protein